MLKKLGGVAIIGASLFISGIIYVEQASTVSAAAKSFMNDPVPGGMCGCMSCKCFVIENSLISLLNDPRVNVSIGSQVASILTAGASAVGSVAPKTTTSAASAGSTAVGSAASGATKTTTTATTKTTTSAASAGSSGASSGASSGTGGTAPSNPNLSSGSAGSLGSSGASSAAKPSSAASAGSSAVSSGASSGSSGSSSGGSSGSSQKTSTPSAAQAGASGANSAASSPSTKTDWQSDNNLYPPLVIPAVYDPTPVLRWGGNSRRGSASNPGSDFKGMGDNVKTLIPTNLKDESGLFYYGDFYKVDPATGRRLINSANPAQQTATNNTNTETKVLTGAAKVLAEHPTWTGPVGCPSGGVCYHSKDGTLITDKGIPAVPKNK